MPERGSLFIPHMVAAQGGAEHTSLQPRHLPPEHDLALIYTCRVQLLRVREHQKQEVIYKQPAPLQS